MLCPGKVDDMSLLEEVNARVAAKNAEILAARIAVYDKIDGPRVGDYMEFPDGKTFRIAHDWSDRVQPVTSRVIFPSRPRPNR